MKHEILILIPTRVLKLASTYYYINSSFYYLYSGKVALIWSIFLVRIFWSKTFLFSKVWNFLSTFLMAKKILLYRKFKIFPQKKRSLKPEKTFPIKPDLIEYFSSERSTYMFPHCHSKPIVISYLSLPHFSTIAYIFFLHQRNQTIPNKKSNLHLNL